MTSVGYGKPRPRKKNKAASNLVCFKFSLFAIQYVRKQRQVSPKKSSNVLQNCRRHCKRSKVRKEGEK